MDFSIATLLSHFEEDKLVAVKYLERKLECHQEEDSQKLQIALTALEQIGLLIKERGKYRRNIEEELVIAKLRCSSKGFCFAIQDTETAEDIYIRESHLSNAWNGDRVLVKIIKEGSRRRSPEGEVKVILERANPSLLAQIKRQEDGSYQAVPLDDRLLFALKLQENGINLEENLDHLVHIKVLRYALGQHPPLAQVTRILGSDAENADEIDIVCCKHDLPTTFPAEALEQVHKLLKTDDLHHSSLPNRLDLTQLLTFTIEEKIDESQTLIENAFSLEQDELGWKLGIHITDIAHFIPLNSPLDKSARKRGTTVYLKEKIIPLFPETLHPLLSLIPQENRFTFSIFINLDPKSGKVLAYEITPSIIQVKHQLTYAEVQALLTQNPDEVAPEQAQLIEKLQQLFYALAPLVKTQRLQRGSFDFGLAEIQSPFKDSGRFGAIVSSSISPIRSLLTELTILAGKCFAEQLLALELPGVYITQPEPNLEDLEDLIKLGNNLNLEIELESEETLTTLDYQRLLQKFNKSNHSRVLSYLLYLTLKLIKYSSKPGNHFGLGYTSPYTHVISPVQRYSDLIIQQVFYAIFEQGKDRRHARTKQGINLGSSECQGNINWNVLPSEITTQLEELIHESISILNDREKTAQDAEKDLEGLRKAEKMKERTGQTFQGLITGVQSYGFFVEIDDLLVEGLVHVSSLKDDWYEFRARHSCLVGRKNRIAYRLGDEVQVEVKSVDYYRQQIDLVTQDGGSKLREDDLTEE